MKKFFLSLVATIGLGICSFILTANNGITADSNDTAADCSDCTCSCGATLQWSSRAYQTEKNCWRCGGDGLVTGTCKNCESCRECGQTGKQKCNDGNGNYDRWRHCRDCSACGGDGWRDVLKSDYTGCTSCGGNEQRAGSGREYTWHSGCKCPRCGNGYTGCN